VRLQGRQALSGQPPCKLGMIRTILTARAGDGQAKTEDKVSVILGPCSLGAAALQLDPNGISTVPHHARPVLAVRIRRSGLAFGVYPGHEGRVCRHMLLNASKVIDFSVSQFSGELREVHFRFPALLNELLEPNARRLPTLLRAQERGNLLIELIQPSTKRLQTPVLLFGQWLRGLRRVRVSRVTSQVAWLVGGLMRPEDLGFVMPCERCVLRLWHGLKEWGESHCPTTEFDYASVLQAHGHLRLLETVTEKDGEVDVIRRCFACRLCGCRWGVFDNSALGWVTIRQESPCGQHVARGEYVDEKKHGLHFYQQIGQGLILKEGWSHGRLTAWWEYRPTVRDATVDQLVVRHWRAPAPEARSEAESLLQQWTERQVRGRVGGRKTRLLACACVRQGLGHLLTDVRCRTAVDVAERFADGQASDEELRIAGNGAMASVARLAPDVLYTTPRPSSAIAARKDRTNAVAG
jgi:hypothetical protein